MKINTLFDFVTFCATGVTAMYVIQKAGIDKSSSSMAAFKMMSAIIGILHMEGYYND